MRLCKGLICKDTDLVRPPSLHNLKKNLLQASAAAGTPAASRALAGSARGDDDGGGGGDSSAARIAEELRRAAARGHIAPQGGWWSLLGDGGPSGSNDGHGEGEGEGHGEGEAHWGEGEGEGRWVEAGHGGGEADHSGDEAGHGGGDFAGIPLGVNVDWDEYLDGPLGRARNLGTCMPDIRDLPRLSYTSARIAHMPRGGRALHKHEVSRTSFP